MPFETVDQKTPDRNPTPLDLGSVGLCDPPPISAPGERSSGRRQNSATIETPPLQSDYSPNRLQGFERKRYAAQYESAFENAIDSNFNFRSENFNDAAREAAKTGKPLVVVFSDIRNTALSPQDGLIGKQKQLAGGQQAADNKAIYVYCDLDSVREKLARGENPPEANLLKAAGIDNRPLNVEDRLFHPSIVVFGVNKDGSPTAMDVFHNVNHSPQELNNSIDRVAARDAIERKKQNNVPPTPAEADSVPPMPEEFNVPTPDGKRPPSDGAPPAPPVPAPVADPPQPPAPGSVTDAPPTPEPEPEPIRGGGPVPPLPETPNSSSDGTPKSSGGRTPQLPTSDTPPPPPVPAEPPKPTDVPPSVEPTNDAAPVKNSENLELQSALALKTQLSEELKRIERCTNAIDLLYGNPPSGEKSFATLRNDLSGAMKDFERSLNMPVGKNEEDNYKTSFELMQKAAKLFEQEQARAREAEKLLDGINTDLAKTLRTAVRKAQEEELKNWKNNEVWGKFADKYKERLEGENNNFAMPTELLDALNPL